MGIHPEDGKREMHSIQNAQIVPPLETIVEVSDKIQEKQKNEEPPVKLSRFKMERMKERLER